LSYFTNRNKNHTDLNVYYVANIENFVSNAANVVSQSIHQVSVYGLSLGFAVFMFLECSELWRLIEVLPLCLAVVEVDGSSNLGSDQLNEIVWTCSTQCKITLFGIHFIFSCTFMHQPATPMWNFEEQEKSIPCNTSLYHDNYRCRFMENLWVWLVVFSCLCRLHEQIHTDWAGVILCCLVLLLYWHKLDWAHM
jgi:hypothetical protein